MRSLKIAYGLLIPSLFGVAGLHRFYMGKVGTGILWFLTWGLCGVGTIYDAVTMARQLRDRDEFETGMLIEEREYWSRLADKVPAGQLRDRIRTRAGENASHSTGYSHQSSETPEHIVLRLAKENGGYTTPAQVALEGNMSSEKARAILDSLTTNGMADIRIRQNGVVAYVFPDFLRPEVEREFEIL